MSVHGGCRRRRVGVIVIMTMIVRVAVMMAMVVTGSVAAVAGVDRKLGRRDARAKDSGGRHRRPVERKAAKRATEFLEWKPGVKQCAQHHVT